MSFIGLGVALSVVFGFLLLALVAELCYLLLWKKKKKKEKENTEVEELEKGVLYGVCCSNNNSLSVVVASEEEGNNKGEADLDLETKDVVLKNNGVSNNGVEESVELELMRLHNLAGPPRFLFTIKEETKEDLESEDGKSRCGGDGRSRRGSRTRSLSDLMVAIDTPFLNSMVSSPLRNSLENLEGFNNPLFESSSPPSSSEFNNRFIRPSSSPPPKFKFLRDAEEKLYRRLMEEAQRKAQQNQNQNLVAETTEVKVKDSPNSTTMLSVINNNREREQKQLHQKNLPHFPSSSSQILPLESSPTTLTPVHKPSMVHY
ncbi:hypothetical protein HN51_034052 [Arachis hypogaea]|uniref:uncharacterized protein LOC107629111 n=1 Tax=Arachis ipaensis TaxID=130454 RepID=UPI0007AF6C08|nr:uncharacterized protein LOC107629111 [Arachis ipaensis]XP_025641945.1 uncharacterized protein LOC112736627 [Arachis hypogaea]